MIFVTSGLAGCRAVIAGPPAPIVVHEPGLPPHAPAHGHRRVHDRDAELRFDSRLGVYVVIGHPGLYVHDGWYLRFDGARWVVSASLDGPWETRRESWVPPGLRAEHHGHGHEHGHHGRGAAKGDG